MKKSSKIFCMVAFIAILLTGCFKFDTEITINKDGSGFLHYTIAYKKSFDNFGGAGSDRNESKSMYRSVDEIKTKLIKENFKVKDYAQEDYVGITAEKSFKNLEELKSNPLFLGDDDSLFESFDLAVKKGLFYSKYDFKAKVADFKDKMGSFGKLNFIVHLPVEPEDHNASEFNMQTLRWDLSDFSSRTIEATVNITNSKSILIIAVIAVLAISLLFTLLSKRGLGPKLREN